jgi:hypothetical protein
MAHAIRMHPPDAGTNNKTMGCAGPTAEVEDHAHMRPLRMRDCARIVLLAASGPGFSGDHSRSSAHPSNGAEGTAPLCLGPNDRPERDRRSRRASHPNQLQKMPGLNN